ncbi:hypothetical protein EOS_31530 [Caballeronia mineralivorans PML1(12)]|uniref:Uncharacterized protein n=1 Tax=Caballeronia mineralivorans PML1(12) TaxID=908627 RepID=A0A0J1CPG6_9BURK|nr:hypothetical protein [Caballeronia mineralivorans]KLU22231.1 hypothetical protein EOS_31530 [Caballeronia mineralivorans PML1(12)]
MAITVNASKPSQLLAAIKKAIDDKEIETWSYDGDGDFTHTPDQWKNKAWLRPVVVSSSLRFGLLGQKDIDMTKVVYGVYHGRFNEMLLTHFDEDFSSTVASAQKDASVDQFN